MNEQKTLPPEETTINGVLLKDLSAASQKLFQKLVSLKTEADELAKSYDSKQAAIKELADMILEEVNEVKAARGEAPAEGSPQ